MKARLDLFPAAFLAAPLLVVSLSPTGVSAAPDPRPIEEIVVTSELRESLLEDTASSITVLSLDDQRSRTVNHLEELLGWVPNVNFASGGARARFPQIRGIGERGQFAEPLNPSVGLVLDGVDLTGAGLTATLFDVRQVEVLRGPQGTLYGANALAGLINVRTNDPTPAFYSSLRLDAGDYGARGVGGVLSGPMSETAGYRLAVQQYVDDGFLENRYLGRDDTNQHDELTARAKVTWSPRADLDLAFAAGLVNADNAYDAFSLDNDRDTRSDEPGQDAQETRYGSVTATWDVSDAFSVVGAFGGSRSDSDYGYDEDWTYVGFHPFGYSSTDRYLRNRDTVSADLRLVSGPAGRLFGGRTGWLAGVYALDQSEDTTRQYTYFDGDFDSRFETRRLAVYGELEHALSDRASLILGLRAERHEADYRDSESVTFDPVDHMYGGRAAFQYDVSDNAMAYVSVSRGYKAGGFNISGTLPPDLREYRPEALWNYEAGLKGNWFEGRLALQGAVFTMRRDDVQVHTSMTIDRGNGTEFIDLISNAAQGRNTGLELELDYSPAEFLSLFANLGLMHTEFDDFVNNNGEELDGEPQAHAPEYQFFVGAELRPAPGWYLRVEAEGKDWFYFSDSNRLVADSDDVRSRAYELWNASAGFEGGRWSVKIWGRNLTDEDYAVRGYYFGNDPRAGYEPDGWFQLGEPRRYGVTVTVSN